MKSRKIAVCITICFLAMNAFMSGCQMNVNMNLADNSLYSWDESIMANQDAIGFLQSNGISRLYQAFPIENLSDKKNVSFIKNVNEAGIEFMYLTGDKNWVVDGPLEYHGIIDSIEEYNKSHQGNLIKSVVLDVEVHTLKEWDDNQDILFDKYCDFMIKAHDYAKDKGIRTILVIPVTYKDIDRNQFADLLIYGCDEVSIMNYNKATADKAIAYECDLCKKWNIPVESIFETLPVNEEQGVTKAITYYYDSKVDMIKAAYRQKNAYGDDLRFAIHCYDSFKDMRMYK